MNKTLKVLVGSKSVILTDKDYVAAGGQGVVYSQGPVAYKIYHDPKTMIPVSKIRELSVLKDPEILAPTDVIFNLTHQPIGFSMPCVGDTEFLCKIFTRIFRQDKRITPQDIVGLVTRMQNKLEYIHQNGILVVDYNEMNFLLSNDIKNVYHIDVDSWQTPHHLAPALMDSVKDYKAHSKFTELSDWFSWAVVTFQMYVGIHPYKGMHPKFKPSEWGKRMEAGISVFDKDVKLPANVQNFSVIPPKHLEWYKEIFIKNDRSIPPYADDLLVSAAIVHTIVSKGDFEIKDLFTFNNPIKNVFFDKGRDSYVLTSTGVFQNGRQITFFNSPTDTSFLNSKNKLGLCSFTGGEPFIVNLQKDDRRVTFYDLNKVEMGSIAADDIMQFNGLVYSIIGKRLIQNSFEYYKARVIHKTDEVGTLSKSYKVFRGVIAQDNFMKCLLTFPYGYKLCTDVYVKELNNRRILDACFTGKVCVVLSESGGKYYRSFITFNDDFSDYIYLEEVANSLHPINVVTMDNGMSLCVDDEKLTLFKDNKRKEIYDPPVEADMRLYISQGSHVMFVDKNKLYSIAMK